ncbi:MarR family winged helix-turn-helix transcriptional regulator [Micromonospora sp. NBC_01699]|uniref:MarR family winged helix-turn-helix transcriptional regulator n=1 Tax=Micromonospora sp. NBC_01699 TaxID=2975984 RepID=UPI002E2FEA9E|nr:MarR family winged helix-turn-helix transcriptional regulator [Micromonospora sp. NBC_01699]
MTQTASRPASSSPAAYFAQLVETRPDIALCRTTTTVTKGSERHYADQPVNVAGHLVLGMLAVTGPCSQQELSEGLRIDRSVMVGCVDGLERAGLVSRERNATDRRAYDVTITATGRKVLAEADGALPGLLDGVFGALSPAERRQLAHLLRKALGLG